MFKAQIHSVRIDPIKLLLGDGAIKSPMPLGESWVVLGHEAEWQTASKFQKEGSQGIQGILNLAREYEVPDKDTFLCQFRTVIKDIEQSLLSDHLHNGLKGQRGVVLTF